MVVWSYFEYTAIYRCWRYRCIEGKVENMFLKRFDLTGTVRDGIFGRVLGMGLYNHILLTSTLSSYFERSRTKSTSEITWAITYETSINMKHELWHKNKDDSKKNMRSWWMYTIQRKMRLKQCGSVKTGSTDVCGTAWIKCGSSKKAQWNEYVRNPVDERRRAWKENLNHE